MNTSSYLLALFLVVACYGLEFEEMIIEQQNDIGSKVGTFNSQLQVNDITASATFTLSITAPPGTANIQPHISLFFSSDTINRRNTLGAGWSLSGVQNIYRCPNNLAENGKTTGVDYSFSDRFCLGPLQLVNITGDYGANQTVYTTSLEQYIKIISYSSNPSSGPDSFVLFEKDGTIVQFGASLDSRIYAQGANAVRVWAVSEVSDRNGNFMIFKYQSFPDTGEYVLKNINYTGNHNLNLSPYNSLNFVYEISPDSHPVYSAGSVIKTTQRMTNIQTFESTNMVLDYRISYIQSCINEFSLISAISICAAADGKCFNSSKFTYDEHCDLGFSQQLATGIQTTINAGTSQAAIDISRVKMGDFDGNGLLDVLVLKDNEPSQLTLRYYNGSQQIISGPIFPIGVVANIARINIGSIFLLDWNTDGRTDIFKVNVDQNGANSSVIYLANRDATFTVISGPPVRVSGAYTERTLLDLSRISFNDFNGDSLPDMYYITGSGTLEPDIITLNLGNRNFSYLTGPTTLIRASVSGARVDLERYHFSDFNADGLIDVYYITGSGDFPPVPDTLFINQNSVFIPTSSINTFIPVSNEDASITLNRVRFVDLNGDGATDYYYINGNGIADTVFLNTGTGVFDTSLPLPGLISHVSEGPFASINLQQIVLTDINLDGFIDGYIISASGTEPDAIWIGQGNSSFVYNVGPITPPLSPSISISQIQLSRIRLIEWEPSGMVDVYIVNNGTNTVSYNRNRKPMLKSFENGFGVKTVLVYKRMVDPSIYQPDSDARFPVMNIINSELLLSKASTENGIGGWMNTTYFYQGAKNHVQGLGFLGFRNVTVTQCNSGITTWTNYSMDYANRLQYHPISVVRQSATGQLLSMTFNQLASYSVEYGQAKSYYSYTKASFGKQNDLLGKWMSESTTETKRDNFGNPVLVRVIVRDSLGNYTTEVSSVYENDSKQWLLGLVKTTNITKQAHDQIPLSQVSMFTYFNMTGQLQSQLQLSALRSWTTQYERDQFGNIVRSMVIGSDITSRESRTVYDKRGQFVVAETNALNQTTYQTVDLRFGTPLNITDVNGLTTSYKYTPFGSLAQQINPDGTSIENYYLWCSLSYELKCPSLGSYVVITNSSINTQSWTVYDILQRPIQKNNLGFNGTRIIQDTIYDSSGRTYASSTSYYDIPNEPVYWTKYQYDELDRVVEITRVDNSTIQSIYSGPMTTQINSLGQPTIVITNALQQVVNQTSFLNSTSVTSFMYYDSLGHPIQVDDGLGNSIFMQYDDLGFRALTWNGDTGSSYSYHDVLGQLRKTIDGNGNSTEYDYDLLGRMTSLQCGDGIGTWTYDSTANGIGKLSAISGWDGFKQSFSYDSLSRLSSTATTINGKEYTMSQNYDSLGRPESVIYPTGVTTTTCYNQFGAIQKTVLGLDCATSLLLQEVESLDASGRILVQSFGNGLKSQQQYNYTGMLISTVTGNSYDNIQSSYYQWDANSNLLSRQDNVAKLVENFEYDSLQRLLKAQVNGGTSQVFQYDLTGNIIAKSNFGDYHYGGAGPHAVTSITNSPFGDINYRYDDAGNMIYGFNRTISYNSFHQPSLIIDTATDATVGFYYDPTGARTMRYDGPRNARFTTYVSGGMYEEVSDATTKTVIEQKHYFGQFAMLTIQAGTNENSLAYFHRDHIGSVEVISNATGQVIVRASYDAFGLQRNETTWGPLTLADTRDRGKLTYHGFTNQEEIFSVNLIHMNGRLYDPLLGRFTSPDPTVQQAANSQSLNLYSYVLNNPLSITDPSGFHSSKHHGFFHKVGHTLSKIAHGVVHEMKSVIVQAAVHLALNAIFPGAEFVQIAVHVAFDVLKTKMEGGSWGKAVKNGVVSFFSIEIAGSSLPYSQIIDGAFNGAVSVSEGKSFVSGFTRGVAIANGGSTQTINLKDGIWKASIGIAESAAYSEFKQLEMKAASSLAKSFGVKIDTLDAVLEVISITSTMAFGGREVDVNPKNGFAKIHGFDSRAGMSFLESLPLDVVDTLLIAQGIPSGTGLAVLYHGWTIESGHSLGAAEGLLLVSYGAKSDHGGTFYAVPLFVAGGTPGSTIVNGLFDAVNGMGWTYILHPSQASNVLTSTDTFWHVGEQYGFYAGAEYKKLFPGKLP